MEHSIKQLFRLLFTCSAPRLRFLEKMASEPFRTSTQPWYAGERICGPDFFKANRIDAVYPDPGTPWRYPNAGCMAGRAQHVLQLIEDLLHGASAAGQELRKSVGKGAKAMKRRPKGLNSDEIG